MTQTQNIQILIKDFKKGTILNEFSLEYFSTKLKSSIQIGNILEGVILGTILNESHVEILNEISMDFKHLVIESTIYLLENSTCYDQYKIIYYGGNYLYSFPRIVYPKIIKQRIKELCL